MDRINSRVVVRAPLGRGHPSRKVPQQSRLSKLVREMRARADLVILDTPPALLTVEVAELSQLIDQVLVVVRQGRVSSETSGRCGARRAPGRPRWQELC